MLDRLNKLILPKSPKTRVLLMKKRVFEKYVLLMKKRAFEKYVRIENQKGINQFSSMDTTLTKLFTLKFMGSGLEFYCFQLKRAEERFFFITPTQELCGVKTVPYLTCSTRKAVLLSDLRNYVFNCKQTFNQLLRERGKSSSTTEGRKHAGGVCFLLEGNVHYHDRKSCFGKRYFT